MDQIKDLFLVVGANKKTLSVETAKMIKRIVSQNGAILKLADRETNVSYLQRDGTISTITDSAICEQIKKGGKLTILIFRKASPLRRTGNLIQHTIDAILALNITKANFTIISPEDKTISVDFRRYKSFTCKVTKELSPENISEVLLQEDENKELCSQT